MKKIQKLSFIFLSIAVLCFFCGTVVSAQSVGGASVQTNSATNISNYQATLNGYLSIPYMSNANYVWFQWGSNFGYGNQTNQQYLNSGLFSQVISGLNYNTTYHFRAVAQGSFGTIYGQDMTFFSSQSNGNGTVTVNAGPDLYLSSGQTTTLQGSGYDPNGYSLNYYWTCTGGTLSSYNIPQPIYTPPYLNNYNNQITYTCTLTATNSYGSSNSDSMIVYVGSNNYNNNYNNYNYNNNGYNNYSNYGSCTYHAYRLCVGSNVYWYDSCGTQQDLYISCSGGQVCNSPGLYGQCSVYVAPPAPTPVQPVNTYVAHYKTACYSNSIFWYDSLGAQSGLYKNCSDANSCTVDSCGGDKCSNVLKCDGSTCATNSADYNTYCATPQPNPQAHCGNGLCEATLGETADNCAVDCKINPTPAPTPTPAASGLVVSFVAKQDVNLAQWQKSIQAGSNSQVYFMISVVNSSPAQLDNVNISANIPSEISSLGNLQLNGVAISGDIVSGVNIGSVASAATKAITFEGKTGTIALPSAKSAVATVNVVGTIAQTDSVAMNFNPAATPAVPAAAVAAAPATSGFGDFLKHWYLWIIVGLVLAFLFVIIFRRLSAD